MSKRKIVPVEPIREELDRLGKAMSDADDKQTGVERCKHMLLAALSAAPSHTEEDVERVAHRICARRNGDCPCVTLKARGSYLCTCPSAKQDARAAIAAMLEG